VNCLILLSMFFISFGKIDYFIPTFTITKQSITALMASGFSSPKRTLSRPTECPDAPEKVVSQFSSPTRTMSRPTECPAAPARKRIKVERGPLYVSCKRVCNGDCNMLPSMITAVRHITVFYDFDDFKQQLCNELYLRSMDEFDLKALRVVFDIKISML